jgi:ADP-heptose:LPS heptosyltransferase
MKILVVRRDNIGDLVCTTPLLHGLRNAFPEAHLAVLVNSYNRAVLLGNPDVDEIFSYDKLKHRRGFFGRLSAVAARVKLLLKMRVRGFDLAILATSSFDRHGLRMARWSGVKRILGFAPIGGDLAPGLTHPIPRGDADSAHEVEIVGRLSKALGVDADMGALRIFPDPQLTARYRGQLAERAPGKRWLALHLSSRVATGRWPAEKFVRLIELLSALPQLGFALFWSPGDADNPTHPGDDEKAMEILRGGSRHCVVALRTARLEELIAGLAACDAFVGGDGGAMHVAAALGLPIVALFENSDAKRRHWYPWSLPHCLLQPDTFAVEDIPVDAVYAAAVKLLV